MPELRGSEIRYVGQRLRIAEDELIRMIPNLKDSREFKWRVDDLKEAATAYLSAHGYTPVDDTYLTMDLTIRVRVADEEWLDVNGGERRMVEKSMPYVFWETNEINIGQLPPTDKEKELSGNKEALASP